MLQIHDDKLDLAVAQMVWRKRRHRQSGPCAHSSRIADQIVQALRCEIFGRILRQVEVWADIGSTGTIQLVARKALHDE